ncbi:hypothetical protein GGE12_003082 [Rhizobium mongolense]|uniref:Uncharacterized protein n=1 Tax=Rhizobium mongolense TaxID=57676 RepID=A0A7W6RMR7_9HYPH|nr:hypothetical protein [Rhizobium mongolense]
MDMIVIGRSTSLLHAEEPWVAMSPSSLTVRLESQLSPKNYAANIAVCSRRSRSMVRPAGSSTSA